MPSFNLHEQLNAIEKLENAKNQLAFARNNLLRAKDIINSKYNEGNKDPVINNIEILQKEIQTIERMIDDYRSSITKIANKIYKYELELEKQKNKI